MTFLSAENLGMRKRGRIEAGQFADLILFDPATGADLATPKKNHNFNRLELKKYG